MLARSTTDFSVPITRAWVSAAVAATCCLGTTTVHADREVARRLRPDPLALTTSTSGRQFNGLGEISPLAGGNAVVYLDSAQIEPIHVARETSEQEKAIALLRGWKLYQQDWDGEGALAPIASSLEQASKFVCALRDGAVVPEPMLHQNGKAGLFWSDDGLYGDLEFLENGRIAYYIEKGTGRHKGVVDFDGVKIPEIFSTLLSA